MHIVAHCRITDPDGFRSRAEEPPAGRPAHWRLISSAPTRDGSACFSVWWADSAEALQRFLARSVGDSGTVECHEVDEEDAMGLAAGPGYLARIPRPG